MSEENTEQTKMESTLAEVETSDDDFEASDDEDVLDDEATMEEDEKLELEEDSENLIHDLVEESQVPVEELRKRYGLSEPTTTTFSTPTNVCDSEENGSVVTRTRSGRIIRPVANPTASTAAVSSAKASTVEKVAVKRKAEPDSNKTPTVSKKVDDRTAGTDAVKETITLKEEPTSNNLPTTSVKEGIKVTRSTSRTAKDPEPAEDCENKDGLSFLLKGENGSEYASSEDDDYEPSPYIDLPWKNEIRVGNDYQASVMESVMQNDCDYTDASSGCILQWPGCCQGTCALTEAQVNDYLNRYHCLNAGLPPGLAAADGNTEKHSGGDVSSQPDDEEALKLLLECQFDIPEALRRYAARIIQKNKPNPVLNNWKEEEAAAFEKGFAIHGKNFFQIMENKLPHRSVAEIVEFYYVWKKTQRCEEFLRCCGCEQKKFLLEPGLTDYMDCFVLDEENLTANYCLQGGFPGMSMVSSVYDDSSAVEVASKSAATTGGTVNKSIEEATPKDSTASTKPLASQDVSSLGNDCSKHYGEDVRDLLRSLGVLQRQTCPPGVTSGENGNGNVDGSALPTPSSSQHPPAAAASVVAPHPLAHLSKPSHHKTMSEVTADDYPMVCGGKVGGSWSLTHSSVTWQDLQHELEVSGGSNATQVSNASVKAAAAATPNVPTNSIIRSHTTGSEEVPMDVEPPPPPSLVDSFQETAPTAPVGPSS